MTSATNPESGTTAYSYTTSGGGLCSGDLSAACTKTSPSPNQPSTGTATVTTKYTYDALNRLTGKSYNDTYAGNSATPGVAFGYDGVALSGCTTVPPGLTDGNPLGRRTAMCDGSGATSWAHDKMGRVLQERRTIGTVVGDYENDAFNLDGSVASVTTLGYGVVYTYGGAARPLTAAHSSTQFVTGASYAPPGELAGMTLGAATGFAGITVANAYNDRLQPIKLSAASPSGTVFSECFDFHLGVAVTGPALCSFSASTAGDNGNVYQIVNKRDSTRSQNFIYDSLNRIQQAYSSGTQWGETFGPTATSPGVAPTTSGIDAWGNLTNRSGVTGKTYYEPLSASAGTNNRLSGFGYDPAGNMTSNRSTSYVYDAENRSIWTSGYRHLYDGNGERVEKCVAATSTTACPTSGANGTLYWKGSGSDPLSETDLSGNVQNTYIFFNGQRVARSDSAGAIHYYFSDHLGSHGVVENATGSACEQDIDYYPYGGVENDYCHTAAQNYKFTGKERDAESGLDNFDFRYYSSSIGRFMKPDNGSAQDYASPQSWNLYSYVMNQPTTATDPDGHDCIYVDSDSGKMTGFNRGDCDNSTEAKANSGIYVDGTVNSFSYDKSSGSLDYSYTGENGSVGVGTILGFTPPQLAPMDNGAMTPLMLGPGDLVLFSGVKTPSFVTDALGKVLGSIFGKTVEETGAAVEEIVAKAGSSVGNQSIKASSRAAAEEAAEKWVGAGARPIFREGEQVGFVSADGTKVARWTSTGKPDPYINLTNNTTGGNLHVHF